jgi:hypothetical protein
MAYVGRRAGVWVVVWVIALIAAPWAGRLVAEHIHDDETALTLYFVVAQLVAAPVAVLGRFKMATLAVMLVTAVASYIWFLAWVAESLGGN